MLVQCLSFTLWRQVVYCVTTTGKICRKLLDTILGRAILEIRFHSYGTYVCMYVDQNQRQSLRIANQPVNSFVDDVRDAANGQGNTSETQQRVMLQVAR